MDICKRKRKSKIEKPYQYDALADDEIRTLIIHPGEGKDDLSIAIEPHTLGNAEKQYTALSYVWGSPKRDRKLIVGEHHIPITRSAFALLKRVRDARETVRVWLDAICINQEETTERSHQVSLMNNIFAGAARVLIWVGDSDAHTADLFQVFKRWEEYQISPPPTTAQSGSEPDQDISQRATEFTQRQWFRRAWTFQEACLSDRAEILCGNHRLPWRSFVMAALYIKEQGRLDVFGAAADSVMALAHFSAANPERETPFLSVLLPLTRDLQASRSKDKVFCLLGMADRTDLDEFKPDYAMETAEVYILCARAMITQERGLSVLSGAQAASKKLALPSWVPDWTQSRRSAYIHGFEWPSPGPFAHQINRNAPFANDIASAGSLGTERHLSFRGARIDVVKVVAKREPLELVGMISKFSGTDRWETRFDQRVEKLRKKICPREDGRALLRTLSANRANGTGGMQEYGKKFTPLSMRPPPKGERFEADKEGLRDTVTYISTFLRNRAVFRTKKGLIGLGPDYISTGDEVWNIVGGDVPFALRPHGKRRSGLSANPQFTLVGECYVDNIMNGELWDDSVKSLVMGRELEFEDIELV